MSLPEATSPPGASLEEMQRRIAELEDAVAARDAFITLAAHELRNPMTPMMGQVDLLLSAVRSGRYTPEQIEWRLERVRQVMRHYVKRAAALLDVSRLTSGNLKLEPTPFDLAGLVREIAETFAEAARYALCHIRVDAPAPLPGTWDRLAVEQIVDNLLSNAIKYGSGRPVEICAEAAGDQVRIRVRDHGPGISAEDRSRIFGRFERAVGLSERRSGFGIGLWVVGQLVEGMGGTITVNDASGGGSVFDVRLPRDTQATRS